MPVGDKLGNKDKYLLSFLRLGVFLAEGLHGDLFHDLRLHGTVVAVGARAGDLVNDLDALGDGAERGVLSRRDAGRPHA